MIIRLLIVVGFVALAVFYFRLAYKAEPSPKQRRDYMMGLVCVFSAILASMYLSWWILFT
jgi:hypothetical protein